MYNNILYSFIGIEINSKAVTLRVLQILFIIMPLNYKVLNSLLTVWQPY